MSEYKAIGGADVDIYDSLSANVIVENLITTSDGKFDSGVLDAGYYRVNISADMYLPYEELVFTSLGTRDYFLIPEPMSVIAGIVTKSDDSLPAVGATVQVSTAGSLLYSIIASSEGYFTTPVVEEGSYDVVIEYPEYPDLSRTVDASPTPRDYVLEYTEGTILGEVVTEGEPVPFIAGIIMDRDTNDPISGVEVIFDEWFTISTSVLGEFCRGDSTGEYDVTFTHAGYDAEALSITDNTEIINYYMDVYEPPEPLEAGFIEFTSIATVDIDLSVEHTGSGAVGQPTGIYYTINDGTPIFTAGGEGGLLEISIPSTGGTPFDVKVWAGTLTDDTPLGSFIAVWCYDAELTSIAFTNCSSLIDLDVTGNALTTLDLAELTNLTECWVYGNQDITTLDLSNNVAIVNLFADDLGVSDLDLSSLVDMDYCSVESSPLLTSINLQGCVTLNELQCGDTGLVSLDVSALPLLAGVYAESSALTGFDAHNCPSLTIVYASYTPLEDINFAGCVLLNDLNMEEISATSINLDGLLDLDYVQLADGVLESFSAVGPQHADMDIDGNNMDASAIDAFFTGLTDPATDSAIDVGQNPGSAGCHPSIATDKGYVVSI